MKFTSEYHANAMELTESRKLASSKIQDRRDNLDKIRRASNGMAIMTEEEAEELGREEIVNHLLSYSKLLLLESMYRSMVTGTKSLLEVIVKTGNPEVDLQQGAIVSRLLNDGLINYRRKFKNFWNKCGGEIVMAGGVPTCYEDKYGWLPKLRMDMVFPEDTELEADQTPFCFAPVQFNLMDLEAMVRAQESDEGEVYNVKNLKKLIDILKEQVDGESNAFPEHGSDVTRSSRNDSCQETEITTIDCWEYYEVKIDEEDGSLYVSKTLFVEQEAINPNLTNEDQPVRDLDKDREGASLILTYDDVAFDNVFDWLTWVAVDTEIGGEKTTSTMRGVAELLFDSSQDLEDLLNLMIEGDKIRAKPKLQMTDEANVGQVAKWDITRQLVAPKGLQKLDMDAPTSHLQTPMAVLEGSTSSIAGAPAGASDDLRVESLAKQEVTSNIQSNRLGEAYDCLDMILEMIVYRALQSDPQPGTEGYNELMWTQMKLEEEGIDYKKLGERKYGRFLWIEVRAQRNIANGDRRSQVDTAQWLTDNLDRFAPQVRPIIMRLATQLRTQDPHLAETLVKLPQIILNQQKVIAENEFDRIELASSAGEAISIAADDIHQDHIPVHLKDMQTLLLRDENSRPWDKDDVLTFTGLAEHLAEHLEVLIGDKTTQNEVLPYLQDYQSLVNQAQGPIEKVEEAEEQREQGPDSIPLEKQIELEQKDQALALKAQEIGIKQANQDRLNRLNARKTNMQERSAGFDEILRVRQLQLQEAAQAKNSSNNS